MKDLSFLFQYIVNPKAVGAILPSSRFLGDKMIEGIDFKQAKYIVEYGPGTGVFTEKLLKKRDPKTIVLLVENNKDFYLLLKDKFIEEENLFIVYGSAENIEQYLREYGIPYADYVISGLPFASLPKQVSYKILLNTTQILNKDGQFITFQYTKFKKVFIERFFINVDIKREFRNVPPAYVFSCTMQEKNVEEYDGVQNSYC
ncbi:SAM-dependent methyltransferase [Peribacillus muralis]|uniref:class I SAM-dependent methyltransferase n=1 Tax=Peribacillus muralis TaxID=264697 RepID=UPI001F4EC5CC|nr:rRNA adenine N-6-methyltransferase family protein [Peribacillus muralis]MCK1995553.1 SAM-dependent methyltransferase [Peribacillus muralis]MCK2016109.1 SAM-dependent methyltransferase [Peribacillus muralis]